MTSLLDVLQPPPGADLTRTCGVVTGVVTNNQDPEKLGRVKVRFPWLSKDQESPWARVAVPMAGNGRGLWILPEVDDEVLVVFEQGDTRLPYVVGTLWSKKDPPPEEGGGGSDVRLLRSRSGHLVRLDDTKGKESIRITDASGKNEIRIDTAKNAISITCEGDLTLESKGGKLVLKAKGGVDLASEDAVRVTGKSSMALESDGGVKVKGSSIDLN